MSGAGINQCHFVGNLGKDPTFSVTPTKQTQVAEFSIAVTTKRGDNEHTEWVRCKAFNRLAEICNDYLRKGSLVYVRGRIQTRQWTDSDRAVRYMTELLVDEMQMLGGRNTTAERGSPTDEFDDELPF